MGAGGETKMRAGIIIAVCAVVFGTAAISTSRSTNQPATQNPSQLKVQHGPIIYEVARIAGSNLEPILRACAKLRQVSKVQCDTSTIIPYSVSLSRSTDREGDSLYGVGFSKTTAHGEKAGSHLFFLVDFKKAKTWLVPNI